MNMTTVTASVSNHLLNTIHEPLLCSVPQWVSYRFPSSCWQSGQEFSGAFSLAGQTSAISVISALLRASVSTSATWRAVWRRQETPKIFGSSASGKTVRHRVKSARRKRTSAAGEGATANKTTVTWLSGGVVAAYCGNRGGRGDRAVAAFRSASDGRSYRRRARPVLNKRSTA